jgi:hypothetical protein
MKTGLAALTLCIAAATAAGLAGCTQMPTEKHGIADLRPQVSFRPGNDLVRNARVTVDGLDVGMLGSYVEGTAALRILPGSHVLTVIQDGRLLLEEKFYVGDGVNRTFLVK